MGYIELYKGMEMEMEAFLGFTPIMENHMDKNMGNGNGNWD